jgi:uncharacterized membrane protein YoaK (UPF0700 family)
LGQCVAGYAKGVTYEWLVLCAILIIALLPTLRWLRRLMWAFSVIFVGIMLIHMQYDAVEAMLALGAIGGGLIIARPIRRILLGGML